MVARRVPSYGDTPMNRSLREGHCLLCRADSVHRCRRPHARTRPWGWTPLEALSDRGEAEGPSATGSLRDSEQRYPSWIWCPSSAGLK